MNYILFLGLVHCDELYFISWFSSLMNYTLFLGLVHCDELYFISWFSSL